MASSQLWTPIQLVSAAKRSLDASSGKPPVCKVGVVARAKGRRAMGNNSDLRLFLLTLCNSLVLGARYELVGVLKVGPRPGRGRSTMG